MIQRPVWQEDRSSAAEHYRNLEQQLMLLPEALHYELLDYFCCLNFSQRRDFILETLDRMGIAYQILRTDKAFHILVKPSYGLEDSKENRELFQAKVFIAHYDRCLQTPGANDNSASVWHLLNLAAQMKREQPVIKTPMQIIFTDREELRVREYASKQGAYLLAQYLRRHTPKIKYVFFVFDQCGIGDTLCYLPNIITSKSVLARQEAIFQSIQRSQIANIPLVKIDQNQYYFSDNLGLNLWNYPALLFSTLPLAEIQLWRQIGQKPHCWRTVHTPNDRPSLLEACSFALMNQILSRLMRI